MLTKIDNLTIHVHAGPQQSPLVKAFLDALKTASPASEPEVSAQDRAPLTPPAIGEAWPSEGGIYGGIVRGFDGSRDSHIVLSKARPESDLTWQAAVDWAKSVGAPHHSDFALPTRFQAAILYGNLRDHFETSGWHWTSTESSERNAWIQDFNLGDQLNNDKSYEARARAVRLIPLTA
jgi:hypothetical protein